MLVFRKNINFTHLHLWFPYNFFWNLHISQKVNFLYYIPMLHTVRANFLNPKPQDRFWKYRNQSENELLMNSGKLDIDVCNNTIQGWARHFKIATAHLKLKRKYVQGNFALQLLLNKLQIMWPFWMTNKIIWIL